jgi:2-polyprenyl-6-methoxyphenol hydroxylase-like FAD-dependent oxidoreductase
VRIACVGGGPTGLYLALLMKLRDPGSDITIFERNMLDFSYGWGVTFGGDLMEKFYNNDDKSAREIEKAASRWASQVVNVQGRQAVRFKHTGYSINRQRLLSILANRIQDLGVHIKPGYEVTAMSQLPEVDLIVACDGVNSRIRLEAGFQTNVYIGRNKYIWLGSDKVFEPFTYAFVSSDSGWLWAYAYGIDSASSTFIVECSPETWQGLGFDAMASQDCLLLLTKLFERHLDGHRLVGLGLDGADVRWLNFRTITNQRWYHGKIVLGGDAAHTTNFTTGWGTKLAIEDAVALAENLQRYDNPELALQSYEKERQNALIQPRSDARFSAQWFENISRYIDRDINQFAMLLDGRRSPLLPHLPAWLYCQLLRVAEEVTILHAFRSRAAPKVKAVCSRHNPI